MKGNEFNLSPREWRAKNKIDEATMSSGALKALGTLESDYYNIADGLEDIITNIRDVMAYPDGRDWEADNLGKGELEKEAQRFQKIQKLFYKSKLGKVL